MTSRLKLFGDYVYLPNTNSFAGSKTASQTVRDASFIIPTNASTLSQLSPVLQSAISKVVEEKPSVGSLHKVSVQFHLLLVDPIKSVLDSSLKTYVVVIDALDECTKLVTVEKFIQAVVGFAPDIPLKFFISSRDTTQLWSAFHHNTNYMPTIISLHTIERIAVQEDIKLYLRTSLSAIVKKSAAHPLASFGRVRHSNGVVGQVVHLCCHCSSIYWSV